MEWIDFRGLGCSSVHLRCGGWDGRKKVRSVTRRNEEVRKFGMVEIFLKIRQDKLERLVE